MEEALRKWRSVGEATVEASYDGELGDASLDGVKPTFMRESLASWRRNSIVNLINEQKI